MDLKMQIRRQIKSFLLVILGLVSFASAQSEVGTNDFRISDMGGLGSGISDAEYPEIAYNSTDNYYLVVWHGDDISGSLVDGEFEIYGQLINAATGEELGTDFRISYMGADGDTDFVAYDPAVAYDSVNNQFLVVWQGDFSDGEKEIYGQRINAETTAFIGGNFRISDVGADLDDTTDANNPEVAYNPNSQQFLVVWSADETNNQNEIYGQRIAADGTAKGTNDFRISNVTTVNASYDAVNPAVTYNSKDNEYLVVWRSDAGVVGEEEIYGQRISAAGAELGSDFRISNMGPDNNASYGAADPDVAFNTTTNEYLVVWEGEDNVGDLVDNDLEIFGQRLTSSAAAIGSDDFRISDVGGNGDNGLRANDPRVAYDSVNDQFIVIWWADDEGTDNENEVYTQILDSNAVEVGANDLRLSDMGADGSTLYRGELPAVAFSSLSNTFLVVWSGDDDTAPLVNGENEIFSQRVGYPEIEVTGNNIQILDGDDTPTAADLTAFGSADVSNGSITRIFPIFNSGNAPLNLTGTPRVEISGDDAADFNVTTTPSASLNPEIGSLIGIEFNPSASGLREAVVTILNNDTNESLFDFAIAGIGGTAEIAVSGNENNISDGSINVSEDNFTDFGIAANGIGSVTRTFSISSIGTGAVQLTGGTTVEISGDTADFAVIQQPDTFIAEGTSTSFQVRFSPKDLGNRKAVISIANNDSSENPFDFSILGVGGSTLDTDGDGDPDFSDPDDDNDGTSDIDEMSDGTDPFDVGSVIERFGSEVCVEWNGFLGFLSQIFELRNKSSVDIDVVVSLFNILGETESEAGFTLEPGIQRDIIINDLGGFAADTYGLVCAKIVSGPAESLGGQLVTYRFTGDSYTLAYKSEFLPARLGKQYITYNTFQPSLNFGDQGNFVANWVQLVNEEASAQVGTLRFYDQAGVEVRTLTFGIGSRERRDIDIHSLGAFKTGVVVWEPESVTARFRMRQNRYYYGPAGISDLIEAVSLPARRGTGEVLITPFDTSGRTVALEISNASNSPVDFGILVYDQNGAPTPSQPPVVALEPLATTGIVLNEYLASGLGNVALGSDQNGTLMVNLVEYGRDVDGRLLYANPSSPRQVLGDDIRGSYNSFLNQECRLRISSFSNLAQAVQITMTRFDGTVLLNNFPLAVSAFGAAELDLCSQEDQQAYGEIKVRTSSPKTIVGEVIRQNREGTIELGGALDISN
jgi:hypothetical protein